MDASTLNNLPLNGSRFTTANQLVGQHWRGKNRDLAFADEDLFVLAIHGNMLTVGAFSTKKAGLNLSSFL